MTTALVLSGIFLLSFFCQWGAWRARLPAILFLLFAGIMVGPVTGLLEPEGLFGDLLFPMVSLSVAVILFEGALTLNLKEIKHLGSVVQRLVSVGALLTWLIVASATYCIFDISPGIAVLFGAIMVVTGPTVIVPLLRTVRPKKAIGDVLRWEGIVIDPIGALLAVVVYEFISSAQSGHAVSESVLLFLKVVGFGSGLGIAGGFALGFLLKRHWIPEYLQNLATLSLVFTVFSVSNELAHESGLLAVTVMGMWLANTPKLHIEEILNFKENLSVLLISGLFIVLAARIDLTAMAEIGLQALLLLAVIQWVARPIAVLASTVGSGLDWREKALLAWVAPRGIVAAAVSAIFALQLGESNQGSELLVPLTFTVIIGTVVLQSLTAKPLAQMLNVAESAPRGFLIVGANPVAQAIGKTLQDLNYEVLLCDTHWPNIKEARMKGLPAFYGNPVSEYADQKLDLVGLGKLLALSPFGELNAIASMRYKTEFGKKNVYTLLVEQDTISSDKHRLSTTHHGYVLFNKYLTYGNLARLLREGAEIKRTKLTSAFSFEDYLNHNKNQVIPLFTLSPKGKLEIFVDDGRLKPEEGWTILSLCYEDSKN